MVGGIIFRRHCCTTCGKVTPSAQLLLSSDDMIEEVMELAFRNGDAPATVVLADSLSI